MRFEASWNMGSGILTRSLVVALAAAAAIPGGCAPTAAPTTTPGPSLPGAAFVLRGTVVLMRDFDVTPSGCHGADSGEYWLIDEGALVFVIDYSEYPSNDGDPPPIVATARLGRGQVSPEEFCVFSFSMDVPDIDEYPVYIENHGAVTYSRDDLLSAGWEISITSDELPPVERGGW